jgi:hypothetical protein
MMPLRYCPKVDADWQRWNHGAVDQATLHRWNPDNEYIYVRGVMVYAFYFETENEAGQMIPLRWNCKYGWEEKGML